MGKAYIADGYTMEGRVEPCDMHEEVKFLFRPLVGPDRAFVVQRAKVSDSPVHHDRLKSEVIAQQVHEWSILNGSDLPVEISEQAAARLHPNVKEKMFAQIMLNRAADLESAKN